MTLHLHRATRADRLAAGLAELLGAPLPDPFATEVVSVPTRGVERWLAQTLSGRLGRSGNEATDGVCAGITFPSPDRMIGEAVTAITGVDPRTDPWRPRQAVWPLLTVIDRADGEAWAQPLWRYLHRSGDSDRPDAASEAPGTSAGRRFATAQHLAELVDSYAANRPQMIDNWLAGRDTDGSGEPLPAAMAWQAELFRRLRAEIDSPGPAERLRTTCSTVLEDPDASLLPSRISVFGPTRMPYATLAVLAALARARDVHLWLPHASPTLWAAVAERLNADRYLTRPLPTPAAVLPPPTGPRTSDASAELAQHRLLAYLGRDARELQLGLARLPAAIEDHLLDESVDDHQHGAAGDHQPETPLLARLQADLAADRPVSGTPLVPIAPGDASIGVHSAHGPDRQVEVLREVILGLLADRPDLEPRDILVMCPDIETFAPLISAAFGAQTDPDDDPAGHPGHRLRVRLADRSLRQLNPLLQVLGRLFDLAESRVPASAIIDLCASEPVATQFNFSDDDLLRLRELVSNSGVRWGFDAADRSRFSMEDFGQNTWAAGLDRMLLGVAMDEEGQHFLGTTLPMDDIDTGDVDLVGRLTEVVGRLRSITRSLDRRQPLRDWISACRTGLELITTVRSADSWQLNQAYGELARIAESAAGRDDVELTRAEARSVLADLFAGRPSRANFRTGTLTVATLMPMRSVPHKVVCLLGLDDGVFPRTGRLDGDDLLALDPWVGDRDRRSEDRQLLLDAIASAQDQLVIIYSGADPRTNAARPPAVPVGELLDVLDRTACTVDQFPVSEQIVHRHPLQPFDPDNFDRPSTGHPFSFDPDALAGARARTRPRAAPTPVFSPEPLPVPELPTLIELTDLIRFFDHPVRAFLRKRAGLSRYRDDDTGSDEIPIELDPLESWSVGDRILRRHLESGIDLDQLIQAEWRRGTLPPKLLGSRSLEPVAREVSDIAGRVRQLMPGEPRTVDIACEIELPANGGGTPTRHTVVGTVPRVHAEQHLSAGYSRLAAKHRLQAWIRLIAMTSTDPRPWRAITVGRSSRWDPSTSTIGPISAAVARLVLADLVDLYRTGLTEPLPLPPATASEYARVRLDDRSVQVLQAKLARRWQFDLDDLYRDFFGDLSLDELLAIGSERSEERGSLAEPSRFGSLARRVWHPLLTSEELS